MDCHKLRITGGSGGGSGGGGSGPFSQVHFYIMDTPRD